MEDKEERAKEQTEEKIQKAPAEQTAEQVDKETPREPLTKDEIFKRIQDALVEALGVEEEEVTPQATLVGDLGAESIDFLDIVFRLEKGFDIKTRGELFPEDVLTNPKYVQDGRVTDTGMTELRKRMPFADLDEFAKNPMVQDFGSHLRVADICRFVESKLGVVDPAPPSRYREQES